MTPGLNPKQALALRRHLEGGLPLVPRPYQALAERLNADENQVLEQMRQWSEQGLFRRIGLVLHHRALGFTANATGRFPIEIHSKEPHKQRPLAYIEVQPR